MTAAPQCPYPDAYMNPILDNVGVDAVYIQFYNNYCSVASGSINFADWDNWAKTVSPNKDVKVFLGAPVSVWCPARRSTPIADTVPKGLRDGCDERLRCSSAGHRPG